jgi:hypothetical protein
VISEFFFIISLFSNALFTKICHLLP